MRTFPLYTVVALVISASPSTQAVTIDQGKYFAYAQVSSMGIYVALSHEKCAAKDTLNKTGYKKAMFYHQPNRTEHGCWHKEKQHGFTYAVVCPMQSMGNNGTGNLEPLRGFCAEVSLERFIDTRSLPQRAF